MKRGAVIHSVGNGGRQRHGVTNWQLSSNWRSEDVAWSRYLYKEEKKVTGERGCRSSYAVLSTNIEALYSWFTRTPASKATTTSVVTFLLRVARASVLIWGIGIPLRSSAAGTNRSYANDRRLINSTDELIGSPVSVCLQIAGRPLIFWANLGVTMTAPLLLHFRY